jgi:hypothetical protein
MKTNNQNHKVSFEQMIALLNMGVQKYVEELGRPTFRNPSFVFTNDEQRVA